MQYFRPSRRAALWIAMGLMIADPAAAAPRIADGEVLVEVKPGLPEHALQRMASQAGARVDRNVPGTRVRVLRVRDGDEQRVAERLARHPHVRFAEPNRLMPPGATPNDPQYPNSWHLPKVGLPSAWSTTTANGAIVAVLDSGVYAAHPDLSGRVLTGWNTESLNNNVTDTVGHGTAVAGTVAAATNNALGVSGVAWGARILPVKISNATDGWATYSSAAAGISWAAANGAKVVNLSYDMAGSSAVESAAQQFRSQGGVVVMCAGNTGTDRGYPAQGGVIFVSATNSADAKTSFSSFGSYVDIAAPGEGILTTMNNGSYGNWWGTSFSAPIVAGTVALMRAANSGLPPSQIESILFSTSTDLGAAGYDPVYGWGRLNAAAAVAAAATASTADATAPTVSILSPGTGTTLSGLVPVSTTASDNVGVTKVELRVAGGVVATALAAPYDFVLDTSAYPNGSTNISAVAFDAAGNTRSASVSVSIANSTAGGTGADTTPPVTTITSPRAGATVSGSVSIAASATDASGVSQMTIAVDGKMLCSGSVPLSCTWNTRQVTAGSHTITATARDPAGNTGTASASVSVGTATKKR